MNFVGLLKRKTLEKRVQQSFLAAREIVFNCNEEIHIALIHIIHIHIVYYLCSNLSMCNVLLSQYFCPYSVSHYFSKVFHFFPTNHLPVWVQETDTLGTKSCSVFLVLFVVSLGSIPFSSPSSINQSLQMLAPSCVWFCWISFPVKREFLLPPVTKCLLTGADLIVGVFSLILKGLHLTV